MTDKLPKGIRRKGNAYYFDTTISGKRTWIPIDGPDDPKLGVLRGINSKAHLKFAKTMAKKIACSVASRSKTFNRECTITAEQIMQLYERSGGRCEVSGIPMDFSYSVTKENKPWRPSIDRIDSSKGYTFDNCRIVCYAANVAMMAWGEAVLRKIAFGMALKHRAEQCKRRSFGPTEKYYDIAA